MKLIASNIGNLTDARFFAAYAPEVLVLPWASGLALANTIQWLEQVKPWIEGPDWAIRLNQKNTAEDILLAVNAQIKVIVLDEYKPDQELPDFEYIPEISSNHLTEWMPEQQVRKVILSDISQLESVHRLDPTIDVYLTIRAISDWQKWKASSTKIDGIVLQGSQEEKVGVKSFDELYDLLEHFGLT
jgi:phosphoribosylanthranilate isomerase